MIHENYKMTEQALQRSTQLKQSGFSWPVVAERLRVEGLCNLHNASVSSQTVARFPEIRQRAKRTKKQAAKVIKRKYTKKTASARNDVSSFIKAMQKEGVSSDTILGVVQNLLK